MVRLSLCDRKIQLRNAVVLIKRRVIFRQSLGDLKFTQYNKQINT